MKVKNLNDFTQIQKISMLINQLFQSINFQLINQ